MKKILFLFVAPALFAASPQYQSGEIIVPAASVAQLNGLDWSKKKMVPKSETE